MKNWKQLVVLLVIGFVGLAIVVPAFVRVREEADKKQCGDNLHNLAIAFHNYHGDHFHLPTGVLGSFPDLQVNTFETHGNGAQQVGVLAMILPYIEADHVFKQITVPWNLKSRGIGEKNGKFDHDPNWWAFEESNRKAAAHQLRIFQCPSDRLKTEERSLDRMLAFGFTKDGTWAVFGSGENQLYGRTSYTGVAGAYGSLKGGDPIKIFNWEIRREEFIGICLNRSRLTLGQITVMDGTANTIMIGEGLGGNVKNGIRESVWSWIGIGTMPTAEGLRRGNLNTDQGGPTYRTFSSMHRNGVQFAWGDGSVRLVKFLETAKVNSKDWSLLQTISGRNDGLNMDMSSMPD